MRRDKPILEDLCAPPGRASCGSRRASTCAAASPRSSSPSTAGAAGNPPFESAARAAAALSLREAARPARRRAAEPGAAPHQPVDRRAEAPHAGTGQGGAGRRAGRSGRVSRHRGHSGAARGDRGLADAPLRAAGPGRGHAGAAGERFARGAVAFAQTVIDPSGGTARVACPNPFYQIYEGAALLAGATPAYLNDGMGFDELDWRGVQLAYVCSPANPTGRVLRLGDWKHLFELQDRHGFTVASDECYSELYYDEAHPPLGALQAAQALGRAGFPRLVSFSSLSKRSNAPGMRSGFVAGEPRSSRRLPSRPFTARRCACPCSRRRSHSWATKRTFARTGSSGPEDRAVLPLIAAPPEHLDAQGGF